MKNFVQSGNNLTLAAPYPVKSGEGVIIGNIFGVAANDADTGEPVDLVTVGAFEFPKVEAEAVAVGAAIYWDDGNKLVTIDDNGGANRKVGVAIEAAANPSASTKVRLNGIF